MAHDLEVGEVLVARWGFDQTNVDFYKVLKVTATTATVQHIKSIETPASHNFMVGTAVPHEPHEPHDFQGEPIRRKVKIARDRSLVPVKDFIRAYRWDGKPVQWTAYA